LIKSELIKWIEKSGKYYKIKGLGIRFNFEEIKKFRDDWKWLSLIVARI
jgi:hypothetical protein